MAERCAVNRSFILSMTFSREFFIQRSFEVAWAVFRVAEGVSRKKLAALLEDRAVEYLEAKNHGALNSLEETVRLASHVGEISEVNAKVVFREIQNLRSALLEAGERDPLLIPKAKKEVDVEEVFSKPPVRLADFLKMIRGITNDDVSGEDIGDRDEEEKPADEKVQNAVNKEMVEKITENKETKSRDINESPAMDLEKSGNDFIKKSEIKSASFETVIKSPAKNLQESGNKNDEQADSEKRRGIIIEILQKRPLCHIKDIIDVLPHISKRTLRYDIQKMVDGRVVERVGHGGPNSFFRLKKKQA